MIVSALIDRIEQKQLYAFGIALMLLLGSAGIVIVSVLESIKEKEKSKLKTYMSKKLDATQYTIHKVWLNELIKDTSSILQEKDTYGYIQDLLKKKEHTNLQQHNSMLALRTRFHDFLERKDAKGIFLINRQGISLASMRDENLGTENLISKYYPQRLEKVFKGKPQFIPPIPSDVALEHISGRKKDMLPTMFIAVPVKNIQGSTIAAFTIRLDPFKLFSTIINNSAVGRNFAFNEDGVIISELNNVENLIKNKFITKDGYILLKLHLNPTENKIAQKTLDGKSVFTDEPYRNIFGELVYGFWKWEDELGIGFATEIDADKALQLYDKTKYLILVGYFVTILLLVIFYLYLRYMSRKTKNEIVKTNRFYSSIIESSMDGIIATDENGAIILCNKSAFKNFGYSLDDFLKINITELFPSLLEDGIANNEHIYKKCIDSICEINARKRDATIFPTEIGTKKIRFNDNIFFAITIHDISKRKLDEDILIQSAMFLKEAQRIAKMGHWEWNIEKDIICLSDEMFHIIGLSSTTNDLSVDSLIEMVHPDDRVNFKISIQSALKNKVPYKNEYRIIKPDGNVCYISSMGEVSFDAKDNPIHMIATIIDFTQIKDNEKSIELYHKHLSDSIDFASLIQHSLIPNNDLLRHYFDDYFAFWFPKDTVGGDIYSIIPINDNEVLIMIIDCTGHGVPGAFVTMLVKALEKQLLSNLEEGETISPANLLNLFNKNIKKLLSQEDGKSSLSNVGFDGGIFLYNKYNREVVYAGAETPLFIMKNGELETIRSDKKSIGYINSDLDYTFTDHHFKVDNDTIIYLTTDGYLDQNGGSKGFPLSKKRFTKILDTIGNESMADQLEMLLIELQKYQGNEDRNDDITVIGLKI